MPEGVEVASFDTKLIPAHSLHRTCLCVLSHTCSISFSHTQYKCLSLYRRSTDILEIQEGQPTDHPGDACTTLNMVENRLHFTTLLRKQDCIWPPRTATFFFCPLNAGIGIEARACTADGLHNVTYLDLKGRTDACGFDAGFQANFQSTFFCSYVFTPSITILQEVTLRCSGDHGEFMQVIRKCEEKERTYCTYWHPRSSRSPWITSSP